MRLIDYKIWILVLLSVCCSCKGITDRKDAYAVNGIDISRYQQEVDWAAISDSLVQFVFVKATEGEEHVDSLFHKNWDALGDLDIRRGAYHFYRPSISAQIQFRNFTDQVFLMPGDLPPVIDFEATGNLSVEQIKLSLKELIFLMQDHYETKPIIYTNLKLYKQYIADTFDDYPIWIARYNDKPPLLNNGQAWTFWQYGNRGRIQGIDGDVDLNVFAGNMRDLKSLCIQKNKTKE